MLLCAIALADSKTLAVQIALDRHGYSPSAIDGQWGRKSQAALTRYCADHRVPLPETPEAAYDQLFANEPPPFGYDTISAEELAAIVKVPDEPAKKAALTSFGYESIAEMYAERGHVSQITIKRLNPNIDWQAPKAGDRILLPDFPDTETDLAAVKHADPPPPKPGEATLLKISLSRFEIAAYNCEGRLLALFPCSIAKDKSKAPKGELRVVSLIARPNYTYTPDYVPAGKKKTRHIFPPGPNNPVGITWIGLSLPGYGIHGTPKPESIGRPESHGCFRLANWNAARLYALCRIGTRVEISE